MAGSVPRNVGDCPATDMASCGLDGLCDGDGSCRRYVAGIRCGSGSCDDGHLVGWARCDGRGLCVAEQVLDCDPFGCDPATGWCYSVCTVDSQCSAGRTCSNHSCSSWSLSSCRFDVECASGFCVDGVCCESACTGPCVSCNLPGQRGRCTPNLDAGSACPATVDAGED
jgi:hypothetical protein